jgi:Tir chaperone protein (CesT) family
MHVTYDVPTLLENLGKHLNLEINPKFEIGVTLLIDNKYRIQLEFLEDRIVLSSKLGEILVSRYRQQVFEDCLKANFKSTEYGALGYNDRQKILMLILNYPIIPPVEAEFIKLVDGFIQKTKKWQDALSSSNTRLLI